jgi:hypothetical protein
MFGLATTNSGTVTKSKMREWYDRLQGGSATMAKAKLHAVAGAEALRMGGEAGIVGGALGFANVMLPNGLDLVASKSNVKVPKIPLDGVVGALLLGASVLTAGEANAVSHDLRNAGGAAFAVFAFRKGEQYMAKQYRMQGKVPGYQQTSEYQIANGNAITSFRGETVGFGYEEDPIIALGRSL